MNRLIPAAAAAAAVALAAAALSGADQPTKSHEIDFTFYDVEAVGEALGARGLGLSPPVAITDSTRDRYCSYFDAGGKRHTARYCTTTAILESGETVGNFNLGGTVDGGPVMAIALVESPPGDPGRAASVFGAVEEAIVCGCWEERRPGGFATVGEWVAEAQAQFEGSGGERPLKSRISGLDQKELVLEVAAEGGLYLWSLVVAK